MRETIFVVERFTGEELWLTGEFTGEVDCWGKHTFQEEHGQMYYLFADEIVERGEADETVYTPTYVSEIQFP